MKKVININFKGRVIPIEEAAFEQLQHYINSLRTYFAQEEGRDEIINDIEDRIAEIFSEQLKKGST
jgi:site-specific recombinase XerD